MKFYQNSSKDVSAWTRLCVKSSHLSVNFTEKWYYLHVNIYGKFEKVSQGILCGRQNIDEDSVMGGQSSYSSLMWKSSFAISLFPSLSRTQIFVSQNLNQMGRYLCEFLHWPVRSFRSPRLTAYDDWIERGWRARYSMLSALYIQVVDNIQVATWRPHNEERDVLAKMNG